jgi:hypothetical protein
MISGIGFHDFFQQIAVCSLTVHHIDITSQQNRSNMALARGVRFTPAPDTAEKSENDSKFVSCFAVINH